MPCLLASFIVYFVYDSYNNNNNNNNNNNVYKIEPSLKIKLNLSVMPGIYLPPVTATMQQLSN